MTCINSISGQAALGKTAVSSSFPTAASDGPVVGLVVGGSGCPACRFRVEILQDSGSRGFELGLKFSAVGFRAYKLRARMTSLNICLLLSKEKNMT